MQTSEEKIAVQPTSIPRSAQPSNEPGDKVRLNLEVPRKLRQQLDDLVARSTCSNLTEVVRRSLALYDLFLEHSAEGGDVVFRSADGSTETLRIL